MIILIVVLGFVGLALLVGFIVFVIVFFKGKKKNLFLVYNKEGDKVRILSAEIRRNAKNKKDKFFFIPALDSELDIRAATKWIDGVGYREIVMNQISEYSYLKNIGRSDKLDAMTAAEQKTAKENVTERPVYGGRAILRDPNNSNLALDPEEKQITLFRLERYHEKYPMPVTKMEVLLLVGFIILFIISVVGVGYTTYQNSKTAQYVGQTAEDLKGVTSNLASVHNTQLNILNLQSQLIAQIKGQPINANLTRQLS